MIIISQTIKKKKKKKMILMKMNKLVEVGILSVIKMTLREKRRSSMNKRVKRLLQAKTTNITIIITIIIQS